MEAVDKIVRSSALASDILPPSVIPDQTDAALSGWAVELLQKRDLSNSHDLFLYTE